MNKKIFKKTLIVSAVVLALFFLQANFNSAHAAGLITCGKTADSMCTLCDIIKGMNTIIQYLMKIAIVVALAILTNSGLMYITSAGNSSTIENAKAGMKNAAIGFIVIFAAYLIIDGFVLANLGAKKDLGITVTSWGNFDCNANLGTGVKETTVPAGN